MPPRYVPEDSLQSPRFTGPSTFARLPYVRTLEDVDLAVVGVPFDTGVTYRVGGRFGPNAVRAASVMLRPYNPNLDVKPFDILSCVDYGDIAIVPGYIERSYEAIEAAVAPIVEAGVVPLLIGGDHACTLPHLRATRSRGPVAVIDFDSHTDAWDSYFGEKYNHGTWMRRAIEEGLVDVAHSIEVGLRGSVYGAERLDGAARRARPRLPDDRGGPRASGRRRRPRGSGSASAIATAFISFDIDVVDPAFAPGTGTPEPGGLSAHDALAIVRRLTGIDFVGFDVVEVDPGLRPGRPDGVPRREPRLRDAVARRRQARGVVGDLARRRRQVDLDIGEVLGRRREQVAIEHDDVGQLADLERAEAVVREVATRRRPRCTPGRPPRRSGPGPRR